VGTWYVTDFSRKRRMEFSPVKMREETKPALER
jgi:hypothetical protein